MFVMIFSSGIFRKTANSLIPTATGPVLRRGLDMPPGRRAFARAFADPVGVLLK
jgi:hypothetical protein